MTVLMTEIGTFDCELFASQNAVIVQTTLGVDSKQGVDTSQILQHPVFKMRKQIQHRGDEHVPGNPTNWVNMYMHSSQTSNLLTVLIVLDFRLQITI